MAIGCRDYKGERLLVATDRYVVIDIETTDMALSRGLITEVAAVLIENEEIVDTYSSLVHVPGAIISDFIESLTGITQQMVDTAPDVCDVLHQFKSFIGNEVLLGHNITTFDINMLYDHCETYINDVLSNDFVDTLYLAKNILPRSKNYKLQSLAEELGIHRTGAHRALDDCLTTFELYKKLILLDERPTPEEQSILFEYRKPTESPLFGKRIAWKSVPKLYTQEFYQAIASLCNIKQYNALYSNVNTIVLNDRLYQRYTSGVESYVFEFLRYYENNRDDFKIYSESDYCKELNIPLPPERIVDAASKHNLKASDFIPRTDVFDENHPLFEKVCVITGTLKMPRAEAFQRIVDVGGIISNSVTKKTNYLILGSLEEKSSKVKKAEEYIRSGLDLEILSADYFYELLDYEG